MMNTFTGMASVTQVASSWQVMISEPSPARQTTVSSGHATLAPIAEGSPNPIVPSPPELTQRRGLSNGWYCAHHIWCWPTSEVMIASPPVAS
jgi:hypothetical protein